MKNSSFNFREFSIQQDRCAMKVCTDAALFGAWTAGIVSALSPQPARMLDVGTGTGLLSLMLAQQLAGPIDAIEIDLEAATQARENILHSPWAARIRIMNADIREQVFEQAYDHVIANPPFFENELRSPQPTINNARHDSSLLLADLCRVIGQVLSTSGSTAILLPPKRVDALMQYSPTILPPLRNLTLVHQSDKHAPFRAMLFFSHQRAENSGGDHLYIKEAGTYSTRFRELLAPYYLEQAWR